MFVHMIVNPSIYVQSCFEKETLAIFGNPLTNPLNLIWLLSRKAGSKLVTNDVQQYSHKYQILYLFGNYAIFIAQPRIKHKKFFHLRPGKTKNRNVWKMISFDQIHENFRAILLLRKCYLTWVLQYLFQFISPTLLRKVIIFHQLML